MKKPRRKPKFTKLRTPEQAKEWLRRRGISARQFARDHGLDEQTVYDLLNGRLTGNRGKAHQAAVAIGMKPDPITHEP